MVSHPSHKNKNVGEDGAPEFRVHCSYNEDERRIPLKRNTLVITAVLFILAVFAWAGWANWEYRKQAAERVLASTAQGVLVPDPAGGNAEFMSQLKGKRRRGLRWKI